MQRGGRDLSPINDNMKAASSTPATGKKQAVGKKRAAADVDDMESLPKIASSASSSIPSATVAGFAPCAVLEYPAEAAEFRFGEHGQNKGIVMRVCFPDGVRGYTVTLHDDAQGVNVEFKWPDSMFEPSLQVDGVPEAAMRALQAANLEVLRICIL